MLLSPLRPCALTVQRGYMYDPNALDDPDLHRGAHRYVQHPVAATGPIVR
jgi:hypothetical protein